MRAGLRMMTFLVCCAAAVAGTVRAAAAAFPSPASPTDAPVSLHCRRLPFLAALSRICDQANCHVSFDAASAQVVIDHSYSDPHVITADYSRLPLGRAIDRLLVQMRLADEIGWRYEPDLKTYPYGRAIVFTMDAEPLSSRRVPATFVETPLADALRTVCDRVDASYVLNLGEFERRPVTITVEQATLERVLPLLIAAAGAETYLKVGFIGQTAVVGRSYKSLSSTGYPIDRNPLGDKITVHCRRERSYNICSAIEDSGAANYTVPEELKAIDADLHLRRMPMRRALDSLGRATGTPIGIKLDDAVLEVFSKHPAGAGSTAGPGQPVGTYVEPKVTIHAHRVPFLVALRQICLQAGFPYSFDSPLAQWVVSSGTCEEYVSVDIDCMPVAASITLLIRAARLEERIAFRIEGGAQAARRVVFADGNCLSEQRVTAQFAATPLVDALRTVCGQVDADYAFNLREYERRPVTIALDGARFAACVPALLDAAGASRDLAFESRYYAAIVERRGPLSDDGRMAGHYPLEDTVTFKCARENAYSVVFDLACSSGDAFTLSEDFKRGACELAGDHVSIRRALEAFGRRIHTPLTILYDDPVLLVTPRRPRKPIGCPPAARPRSAKGR
ncbi:MAG TPA: hypothetical protein VKT77_08880 [Chthonomonadaceae bacterium]|nr:hypothetical protein [Chthonomonadaceae bacterium]